MPNATQQHLATLLAEALEAMEHENDCREQDVHGLECGNCIAGVPMTHSLGCRIKQALRDVAKAQNAAATFAQLADVAARVAAAEDAHWSARAVRELKPPKRVKHSTVDGLCDCPRCF